MPDETKLKLLFVVNPISGGLSKQEIEDNLADNSQARAYDFDIYRTTGKQDKQQIQHLVSQSHPHRIVVVGGDGTLKMVAEATAGKNIPIGLIPAGSANGMARELGLPFEIDECLEKAVNGVPDKIDVIRINNKETCVHMSDIGMNAQLVKYFEERNLRGKFGYVRGLLKMFLHRTLMQISICNDSSIVEKEAFMVVLANARMYGTGAMINPDGDMRDGRFEVIVVRRLTLLSLLKMFFKRKNFNTHDIEIFPAQSVIIDIRKKAHFQVDGEYKGKVKHIEARIEHEALYLLK